MADPYWDSFYQGIVPPAASQSGPAPGSTTYGFGVQPNQDPTGLGRGPIVNSPQDPAFWQDFYRDVNPPQAPRQAPDNPNARLTPGAWPPAGPTTRSVTTVPVNRPAQAAAPAKPTNPMGAFNKSTWSPNNLKAAYRMAQPGRALPQLTVRGGGTQRAAPVMPASMAPRAGSAQQAAPPPPATISGSATGRSYNIGQTYQAAGRSYLATPNGFVAQGRTNPNLSPAATYAAANAGSNSAGNGTGWQADVPGTPGYSGGTGRYD